MAYSAADFEGMTIEEVQQTVITQQNENDRQKLQKLIDDRNSTVKPVSPFIRMITEKTVRTESGFVTEENQFIYNDGKSVPKGISYHIHYTSDLKEYFMTDHEHTVTSKVINKVDSQTDFTTYQLLKGQTPMLLNGSVTAPSKKDIGKGYYIRYFAKKVNDKSPFEIKKSDMNKSPLYEYTSVVWHFRGSASAVNAQNRIALDLAELRLEGMKNAIPDLQFFVEQAPTRPPREIVEERLSKIGASQSTDGDGGQSTTPNQTQQSETQQSAPSTPPPGFNAGSGPPPGFGGSGGGY